MAMAFADAYPQLGAAVWATCCPQQHRLLGAGPAAGALLPNQPRAWVGVMAPATAHCPSAPRLQPCFPLCRGGSQLCQSAETTSKITYFIASLSSPGLPRPVPCLVRPWPSLCWPCFVSSCLGVLPAPLCPAAFSGCLEMRADLCTLGHT